ncbi:MULTISPECIES: hypothetical protein [unclassified Burkholderia]|uniref:hypothetical protein n=1 Tax=unclassified Burkholderia TaxID=2613784 RepID=UPI002AB2D6A4|nr:MULTISPECIES: hypothetical protein [unclassified Burkholderia]
MKRFSEYEGWKIEASQTIYAGLGAGLTAVLTALVTLVLLSLYLIPVYGLNRPVATKLQQRRERKGLPAPKRSASPRKVPEWIERRRAAPRRNVLRRRPGIKSIHESSLMAAKPSQKIPPPQRVDGIVFYLALHEDRWAKTIGVAFEHRGRTWAVHRSTLSDPHTPALFSVSDVEPGRSLGRIMEARSTPREPSRSRSLTGPPRSNGERFSPRRSRVPARAP